jgi:hypothetical protein
VGAPGKIETKLHLQFCRVCFVTCLLSLLTPFEYFWSVHAICSCRSSMITMFAKGNTAWQVFGLGYLTALCRRFQSPEIKSS